MKFLYIGGSKEKKIVKQYFLEEAQKLFDSVLYVPLDKIKVECIEGKTKISFKGTDLTSFDACYLRLFSRDFIFGEVVLDILNESNVFVPLSSEAYQICNHKYYTIKLLSQGSIPIPKSSLAILAETAVSVTNKIGFPVIIKLLSGFGGRGVMLAQNEKELKPVLDTLRVFKEFISTQEYFPGTNYDIRCYVIGDNAYGVKRTGEGEDWRSNVSRGGRAEEVKLSEEMKSTSIRVAKLIGAEICAVDFIETEEKEFKLIEVNFAPGIIPKYFGNKFAKLIVRYIYEKAKELHKE